MKITSQLSEKCRKCPRVNVCDEKRMEACARIEIPDPCMASALSPSAADCSAEVLVKHDCRDIKINSSMTVPLDLEEVKRKLTRDLYKGIGLCIEFWA